MPQGDKQGGANAYVRTSRSCPSPQGPLFNVLQAGFCGSVVFLQAWKLRVCKRNFILAYPGYQHRAVGRR